MVTTIKPHPLFKGIRISPAGKVYVEVDGIGWAELPKKLSKAGYFRVALRGKRRRVGELVARTFLGKCPEGYKLKHINGNKKSDYLINLKYYKPKNHEVEKPKNKTKVK